MNNNNTIELPAIDETADMRSLPVRRCSIISIESPEWGTWGIAEDRGDWYVIRGRSGDRVLSKDEAVRFWRRVAK